MPEALAFFRGQVVPLSEAKVSVTTHALHYGTAVFEGIRGNWNTDHEKLYVFRMREHYERLMQGCRIMMMDIPYGVDDLCEITLDLLQRCGYKEDLYIRPLAYKSEERVANLKLQDLSSDFTLIVVPFGAYIDVEGAIRCCTSSWRRVDDTIIPPRVKISGHYVNSILAKTEATLSGFDEAIMLTQDGDVSEGSGENLFPRVQRCSPYAACRGQQPDGNYAGLCDTHRDGRAWAGGRGAADTAQRALPRGRDIPDGHGGACYAGGRAGCAANRRRRRGADNAAD